MFLKQMCISDSPYDVDAPKAFRQPTRLAQHTSFLKDVFSTYKMCIRDRQEPNEVYCIVGNIIDRQPENGGNGCGYQENLAYTITTCDRLSGYPDKRSNPED